MRLMLILVLQQNHLYILMRVCDHHQSSLGTKLSFFIRNSCCEPEREVLHLCELGGKRKETGRGNTNKVVDRQAVLLE